MVQRPKPRTPPPYEFARNGVVVLDQQGFHNRRLHRSAQVFGWLQGCLPRVAHPIPTFLDSMAFCRPSRTGRCAPACRLHKPGAKQAPNPRPWTRQALACGLLMWAGGLLAAAPVFAQTPSGCAVPVVPGGAGLGLQDALARVDCHPLVRRAAAQLQAARADQTTAGQRPNPNLAVGAYSFPRTRSAAGGFMARPVLHPLVCSHHTPR